MAQSLPTRPRCSPATASRSRCFRPSAGADVRDVRLLSEAFDPATVIGLFAGANPGLGGVASFIGEVRPDDGVEALELSHYAPLTLPGMHALADEAFARF